MKSQKIILLATLSCLMFACDAQQTESAAKVVGDPSSETVATTPGTGKSHITWDSWGVPHIFAESEQEIFFADGWAQMQAHANTILKLYGRSRGRAVAF